MHVVVVSLQRRSLLVFFFPYAHTVNLSYTDSLSALVQCCCVGLL